jgi:hypothetical protein
MVVSDKRISLLDVVIRDGEKESFITLIAEGPLPAALKQVPQRQDEPQPGARTPGAAVIKLLSFVTADSAK